MFTHFQTFAASVRPDLDRTFIEVLNCVLGKVEPGPEEALDFLTAGKKLRGTLLCLVDTALGGTLEECLPRAVAIEMIQTATLLHDDFVDQHRARRRLPAVWTLQGARRAVLLGDVIFSSAIQMMGELGREDGLIIARAIAEISRGAYHEPLDPAALMAALATDAESATYDKIIHLKTAVLFGAACQLGAVAAGRDSKGQEAWRYYGLRIGQAYQLADDLQDVQRVLARGEATLEEVIGLVPAFRFFVPASQPCLGRVLQSRGTHLDGETGEHFRTLANLLSKERERRLEQAQDALAGQLARGPSADLLLRAPGEIIGAFDAAEAVNSEVSPP